MCTKGSITVCLLICFLQPSAAGWDRAMDFVDLYFVPDQLSLRVSPVEAGTCHEMEVNG